MRRRELLAFVACVAGLPPASWAQQKRGVRSVGIITNLSEADPEGQARAGALVQELRNAGWIDGQNLRLFYRWPVGDGELIRKHSREVLAELPDVIVAGSSPVVAALQQLTSTVPVVFVNVIDPVGGGFVARLNRPGGNFTGFTAFEYGIATKWLDVLKQVAPHVARVAVVRDPTTAAGGGQLGAIQGIAPFFKVEPTAITERNPSELESSIGEFARQPNGGLVVTAAPLTTVHRRLIVSLAARHKLPAVYPFEFFAAEGGLISYGPDLVDPYRHAAGYVARILKGENPAELPVQAPTKFRLAVNMKTAKSLGLDVPAPLLATADRVIE